VETRRCVSCGREFLPSPRVKSQQYCADRACQRARKRLWQKGKLAHDEDYRLNQNAAQKAWRDKNPGYWKNYRKTHSKYVTANRESQRLRRARKKGWQVCVAKIDAILEKPVVMPGTYQLVLVAREGVSVAKMDAITVEISVMSSG
jgi:hypothetical protein